MEPAPKNLMRDSICEALDDHPDENLIYMPPHQRGEVDESQLDYPALDCSGSLQAKEQVQITQYDYVKVIRVEWRRN